MKNKFSDFDLDYLGQLYAGLIPVLREANTWVSIEHLTNDREEFLGAVVFLAERGYFDDRSGHIRIEFGRDNARLRWIPDREIAMINR